MTRFFMSPGHSKSPAERLTMRLDATVALHYPIDHHCLEWLLMAFMEAVTGEPLDQAITAFRLSPLLSLFRCYPDMAGLARSKKSELANNMAIHINR